MRRLFFLCVIAVLWSGSTLAQDPANFHVIFGNRDASTMTVQIGSVIDVPIWGATDPTPGNGDTVNYMCNPLLVDLPFISSLIGGHGTNPECDTIGIIDDDIIYHMRSASEADTACLVYTLGDTVLLATFQMRVSNDPSFIGQIFNPFSISNDPPLLWDMVGGVRSVTPTASFSLIFFIGQSICDLTSGDLNGDGSFNGLDIVYLVSYLKGYLPPPNETCECPPYGEVYVTGDMNGDCYLNGLDVTYGVTHLKGGPPIRRCPACD